MARAVITFEVSNQAAMDALADAIALAVEIRDSQPYNVEAQELVEKLIKAVKGLKAR